MDDAERVTTLVMPRSILRDEGQFGHAQKMDALGQITGGIAHELNNMLLAINLNLDALSEEVALSETTQTLLDGAQQAIEHARDVIAQLLAFARRQPLDADDFNVNHAVVEARALIRLVLPVNIEIETRLDPRVGAAHADRAQFEMALINLALNAADAMPGGGRLTIATLPVGDRGGLEVTVSDTGAGMSPAVAQRAFEPFFTTRADLGRSGLGLSQVYGYAQQSGGRVEIDSSRGGVTIRLQLPGGNEPTPLSRPPAAAAQTGRGERILVVEDAPLVRHVVGRMLGDLGYQVFSAAGPEEALLFLESQSPIDLLFTDIMLPGGINGEELAVVARRLRPTIRVLYTSGYSRPQNAGDDASLIAKPYTRIELANRLRTVLDNAVAAPA